MSAQRAIGENELHAYIDGALSQELRDEVEAWLTAHPADRSKVDAWIAQNQGMHALYDGVLDERLPAELSRRLAEATRQVGPTRWMQAAAAVLLLAVGFGAGWGLHRLQSDKQMAETKFIQQAVGAHVVFTGEKRHAVEVWADKEERHLVRWLSKRLGHPVQPPPLGQAGFKLVGGRLVADQGGPAAQFMYEDAAKRRITLYVRRVDETTNTAFRYVSDGGVAAFYWIDRPLSYAVIARMERDELLRLARIVYDALGGRDPAPASG